MLHGHVGRRNTDLKFALDQFLQEVDFSEWSVCCARSSRTVSQQILKDALAQRWICSPACALMIASIPSPLAIGIRNFLLRACATEGSSWNTQPTGKLLLAVDLEIQALPRYSGRIAFRWCRNVVASPEPDTEILFPALCFASTSLEDAIVCLQSEETETLSGTVVVIETGDGAHSLEPLLRGRDQPIIESLLFGDAGSAAVVFSPFQRFALGEGRKAREIFLNELNHPNESLVANVSFWMLYEIYD
jgi:hypothetical protein